MSDNTHTNIPKCPELETSIKVNKNTHNPHAAWKLLCKEINKVNVTDKLALDTPIYENKVRFVCISDTHSKIDKMHHKIPPGDILIHAGDFTNVGSFADIEKFSQNLEKLNDMFKYKVVIAGNHELSFDPVSCKNQNLFKRLTNEDPTKKDPRALLKHCIYLEDSMVELFGIKIYGSPWQPRFGDWAYNETRGENILRHWNRIPNETDVLISDIVRGGDHVGCCELLTTIRERVKPKFHVFGHIHEDYGCWSDGTTTYINASICSIGYIPANPPILFDIELPEGFKKE